MGAPEMKLHGSLKLFFCDSFALHTGHVKRGDPVFLNQKVAVTLQNSMGRAVPVQEVSEHGLVYGSKR